MVWPQRHRVHREKSSLACFSCLQPLCSLCLCGPPARLPGSLVTPPAEIADFSLMKSGGDGRNKLLLAVRSARTQGFGGRGGQANPSWMGGGKKSGKRREKDQEATDVTICTTGRASELAYAPCVVGGSGTANPSGGPRGAKRTTGSLFFVAFSPLSGNNSQSLPPKGGRN